jgi:choline-glycine betaine transporter
LGWVDKYSRPDYVTGIETTAVWVITIICTASAISGVHGGIRLLSVVAVCAGLLLLCTVFFLDDSKFLLNLIVQEFGYYFQTSVFLLNFWTDAFGQLREGSGRAIDGKAAETWWMDTWMVFYQAWWSVTFDHHHDLIWILLLLLLNMCLILLFVLGLHGLLLLV